MTRPTKLQRWILNKIHKHYRLGSYFSPSGWWSLVLAGHPSYKIRARTIQSMYDKGYLAGNVCWPYLTGKGWEIARGKEKRDPRRCEPNHLTRT